MLLHGLFRLILIRIAAENMIPNGKQVIILPGRSVGQQSYGCYKNSTVDLDIVLDDPILPNQASWPPPLHGNLYDG